jgi:putative peptide zinc metalloprotease protein
MLAATSPSEEALPRLREDLNFADAGFDISGDRGTIIYDPVQHSFVRLSSASSDLLGVFRGEELTTGQRSSSDEIGDLAGFLNASGLLQPKAGAALKLEAERVRRTKSLSSQFLHNYISFRLPLFNPEPFLDWSLPIARLLATRFVFICILIFSVVGIYFASQQWDHFLGMLHSSYSLSGAASFAVTMVVLKIFHELGHAYVARHFGCRVPSIGIAFMVLTPMLYTDASDAWRLKSRRQRVLIGAAGIIVELGIAAVALFLWAFLPDGAARGIAFFVAVTAWIMSVLVNLSPFMRFDGYHILVDVLSMHSLGPRGFALANWQLREFLFKPNMPPPEFFAPGLHRFLVCFAYATWVYRLTLFLGIAYLIYTMFPKAAGIALGAVEIHFFILRPILKELREWRTMGLNTMFMTPRGKTTAAILAALVMLALLPLDRHVHVPAVLLPVQDAKLYPPEAAMILQVSAKPGDSVVEGQILGRLFVPDIADLQRIGQLRLEVTEGRLLRVAADARDLAERRVLEQEREAAVKELEGLRQRGEMLVLHAPISGTLTGDAISLRERQWVGANELLFHIVDRNKGLIIGLVAEREAGRVAQGAEVSFVAQDGLRRASSGVLKEAGLPGAEGLAATYLSSQFGGPIAVNPAPQGGFEPMTGRIPLVIATDSPAAETALTGTAKIAAEPQSFAGFLLGRMVTVVMRESGF